MQSLGNLNSVSGNSITFSAVENVVVPEGPSVYTARVPTWEAIRKLGNVSGNGFSITQNFTLLGNMAGNVTFSVDSVSNVTYSIVGNSVSINNIRSVQDYLGTRLNVTIGNDVFGNFSHQGNVINTNSGNNFQYDINVLVPNSPEFNTANLANIAYDFFGSNVSNLNNIVTDISNSAPRVVTFNQPAGNANVTITSQDATAFISLNTTSTVPITKTFSTANGNGVMSLAGTRDDINSHLSTLTMTKNYSETTTGNITLYTGGSISSTQVKFGTNSFKIANATFPSSGYQASGVTYDLANANDFCAECWVRMSGFAASGDVDIFEVGNKAGFRIQWDTFAVKTWFYYGSSTIDAGFTLTPNTWSHVAIERVGNIVYFYANGSRSATSLTITTQTVTGGNAFYIGGPNNFGSDVYVDEFRISGQSRYYDASSSSYTVPSSAFTFDSGTYQLAHFEDTTNQYFSTITPNRSVRQISYAYSGASGPILETVSANYYAAFEDPIHVGNDVNYQKVGMPGWLYGTTSAYGGSGQESVRPHKITYAGRHPATGEPHFAYPFTTDAGNVAVKIYGLRTTSAAVIPGPLYDLGVANSATPQVTTSIVSGNAYTQANTVILLGTSVAGKTGNLGCDAGDYTSVAHTPLLSYNAITPDYSTIYSLNFPSGSFAASYRCANDTFQGASVVTANTVGTGTKHSITRYQTRTNVSGT